MRLKGRQLWSALVVGVATSVIATMAVLYQGFSTARVDLNDGGVWVTRTNANLIGHLNYPSLIIDSATTAKSADYDILQDGNDVVTFDSGAGTLAQLDPAKVAFSDGDGSLAGGSRVALHAGVLAIIDAEANGLYVISPESIAGFAAAGRDPLASLGAGSVVTVSVGGTVFAVSREDSELLTVKAGTATVTTTKLPKLGQGAALAISAVGETPVVLDSTSGTIYTPDRTIQVPDAREGRLQAAGAANESVVIATPSGLVKQPLDGGKDTVVPVAAGGTPTDPVWLNGCAYAVWSGTAAYVRDCSDDADDRNQTIPGVGSNPILTLRQNRNVVVINEIATGMVWLADKDMVLVKNWEQFLAKNDAKGDQDQSDKTINQYVLPKRDPQNHKPIAVDDHFGVRAGSTAVLPVLDNDSDPDGDLLEASPIGGLPQYVKVEPSSAGAALQVSVGSNAAPGVVKFKYEVDDGRENGKAQAWVYLDITSPTSDLAPVQDSVQTVRVEVGATTTLDSLLKWSDPDGDDLFLKKASDEADNITYRSNGVVRFTESTHQLGIHTVKLVISDGSNDTQGELKIDVRAKQTLPPIANSDRYSAMAGQRITVSPVANDMSPSGETLRLSKLDQVAGTKVVPDYTNSTFSFSAAAAGAYYVQYQVSDGPKVANGIVRIDVHAPSDDRLNPLATKDTALVPSGGGTLVDVLANDSDPAGGILVLQSVTLPSGSAVSAEVLEHHILRVTDSGGLNAPTTLSYRVSNGRQWSDGQVTVIPVALPDKASSPVAVQDKATVRAGDVVTIDVLANDYDPSGATLTLQSKLVEIPDAADGYAWVSDGKLRFRAGQNAKQVSLVYNVTDSQNGEVGDPVAGRVLIQVTSADASDNSAPLPESVTARTIAGTSVRVPIPLNGIDPDGDSVTLVGVGTAPKDGWVSLGDSWLTYQAYPGVAGQDTFEYLVRDRLGATATGSVTVGIAAPSNQNQAPYAVPDDVSVRPGRSVSVPVLSNDSDPDGDQLALAAKLSSVSEGVEAKVVDGRVLVKAPAQAKTYSIIYTVVDPYGARSQTSLLVHVDPNAPLQAPVARDDYVEPVQISNKPTVAVNVLANDEDPDGVAGDLKVTSDDPSAVTGTDGNVTVSLAKTAQVILYTITDIDQQATSAVIFVPGTDAMLPTLKSQTPREVVAGKQLRLPLSNLVQVRPGHSPRISEADSVRASHAGGGSMVADASTLTYTSDPDYYGPDAVSVQVTDGTGPDDPKGNSAYLSIPIQVYPATNQPPTFLDTAVTVSPGEGAADVNWRKLSSDPDKGDLAKLTIKPTTVPAHLTAKPNRDHLLISADAGAQKDTQAEITVEVSDGTHTATGTVKVFVTATQRIMPVAVADTVNNAPAGQPVTVHVLDNDTNPFQDTGAPLTLLSTKVLSGKGNAQVKGSDVVVTPEPDFHGTLTASYRIQDATRSTERESEAKILVTVLGHPDAPGTPTGTAGDRTVVLSWSRPANNGSSITSYTVTDKSLKFSQKCVSTTCTLKNLTNNTKYHFSVIATNDVGDSDPSPVSAELRPDAKPDQPDPPTLVFGDKCLTVAWKTPHTSGSPVQHYTLEISGDQNGAPQMPNMSGNKYEWCNLTNGNAYQVRVQAWNLAPDPSEWSEFSKPEVPAGKPDAPGRPTSDPATPVGSQAQITVTWPEVTGAAANGDAVSRYTLSVIRGGSTIKTVQTSGNRQNVTIDTSTSDLTFTVTATNKAGTSADSPTSAPRRAAVAPDPPTSVTADPGDGKVTLTFVAGDLNGSKAGEITYHYENNQTGATGTISSGGTIGGLSNGTKYSFDVWATSSVNGVEPGKRTTSNTVTPYGKPIITLSNIERLNNAVRFTWHVDSNGAALTSGSPSVDGSGNGSFTKSGLSAGESYTLTVSYTNKKGTSTEKWTGQANDPPPPAVSGITKGGTLSCTIDGVKRTCNYVVVHLSDGFSGSKSVCATGAAVPDGVWGAWDPAHPCLTTSFSNGVGQTGFWLASNNIAKFDIKISIAGYTPRTARIW